MYRRLTDNIFADNQHIDLNNHITNTVKTRFMNLHSEREKAA